MGGDGGSLALLGLVAVVPLVALMLTSFVKVSVVLSLLRNAIGATDAPSGLIVMGLSLVLTAFVMAPVAVEMVQAAATTPAPAPGPGSGSGPAPATAPSPTAAPSRSTAALTDAATGTAPVTGAATGTAPVTATGTAPVTDTGTAPGAATGTAPVTAPGAATGTAPVTAPGAATGAAPVTATGTAPVTATGTAPVTATGTAPVTATGTPTGALPAAGAAEPALAPPLELEAALRAVLPASRHAELAQVSRALGPLRRFLARHAAERDRATFVELAARMGHAAAPDELRVLAPAFLTTELREAFAIAVLVFVPFLVLDLLIGLGLAALGLASTSPQVVALPLKLLLFVAVDGWRLLVDSLLRGYV